MKFPKDAQIYDGNSELLKKIICKFHVYIHGNGAYLIQSFLPDKVFGLTKNDLYFQYSSGKLNDCLCVQEIANELIIFCLLIDGRTLIRKHRIKNPPDLEFLQSSVE